MGHGWGCRKCLCVDGAWVGLSEVCVDGAWVWLSKVCADGAWLRLSKVGVIARRWVIGEKWN